MKKLDEKKIQTLIEQAYKVVVRDLKGKTFPERYDVYQFAGFEKLLRVVISEEGKPIEVIPLWPDT